MEQEVKLQVSHGGASSTTVIINKRGISIQSRAFNRYYGIKAKSEDFDVAFMAEVIMDVIAHWEFVADASHQYLEGKDTNSLWTIDSPFTLAAAIEDTILDFQELGLYLLPEVDENSRDI